MENETKEMKGISWSFFWRLFLWNIVILIPLMAIIGAVTDFNLTANLVEADEIIDYIKAYKPYVIATIIAGFITRIASAKLATNGILKKYEVTEENKHDVLKKIAAVFVVILCLSIWSNITTLKNVSNYAEQYESEVKKISKMSLTDKDEELLEEMDSFISFSDKIIVVQILCNAASIGLAYYLERKWIIKE
ncbi:MAG: hypothetical protein HFJ44_07500 [Clostridia bacterium]|jgi:hypothetical protein|nr:hypothetical protein [Clostridia bacterium]